MTVTRDESEREGFPLHCACTRIEVSTASSTLMVHVRTRGMPMTSLAERSGSREILTVGLGTAEI